MPVLKDLLNGRIQKQSASPDWEAAVRTAALPLKNSGDVTEGYIDAMVANIRRLGSYMVLTPGMAMPHSRPEDGCIRGGLSLLVLDTPVLFPDNQEVWFILALGAQSSDAHISAIEAIADFLGDDDTFQNIRQAKTTEEILSLIP